MMRLAFGGGVEEVEMERRGGDYTIVDILHGVFIYYIASAWVIFYQQIRLQGYFKVCTTLWLGQSPRPPLTF